MHMDYLYGSVNESVETSLMEQFSLESNTGAFVLICWHRHNGNTCNSKFVSFYVQTLLDQ